MTNNTPDNTEEVVPENGTPDNTDETNPEEVDLEDVGKNFQESKRNHSLAEKEAKRYSNLIDEDGNVDFKSIGDIHRGNAISDIALGIFCEENGLDKDDAKQQVQSNDRVAILEARIAEMEKTQNTPEKETFTDILKNELSERGISSREFSQYKDTFEEELEDLSGLPDNKAIGKALDLAVGRRSRTKVVASERKTVKKKSKIMTKDQYLGFLSKRSKHVGDAKAIQELDAYKAERASNGEPLMID